MATCTSSTWSTSPSKGGLDKELKPKVNPALLLRAFYWFRWGAMYTFLFGLALFVWHYLTPRAQPSTEPRGGMTGRAMWILFGVLLGTIMWFNVWFVIWPRQKKILGGLAAGTPHPDAAKLAAPPARRRASTPTPRARCCSACSARPTSAR